MTKMIDKLKELGYKQTSLSVAKDNYAVKMYKNLGFEVIAEKENDYLMLLELNYERAFKKMQSQKSTLERNIHLS